MSYFMHEYAHDNNEIGVGHTQVLGSWEAWPMYSWFMVEFTYYELFSDREERN